jgi:hypothetical protein
VSFPGALRQEAYAEETLIIAGLVGTAAGIGLLIGLVLAWDSIATFVPGLLLIGLGLGVMQAHAWAMRSLAVVGLISLGAAPLLPANLGGRRLELDG